MIIYHLSRAADWHARRTDAAYLGPPDADAEGFIHFSTAAQVADSAQRHFAGVDNLLLIAVDTDRLGDRPGAVLRWETNAEGIAFPHLYGAVPLAAVISVTPLTLDPDGSHNVGDLSD